MSNERRDSHLNRDFLSALAVSTFPRDFTVRILPVFKFCHKITMRSVRTRQLLRIVDADIELLVHRVERHRWLL
jgi:hypothetical protein